MEKIVVVFVTDISWWGGSTLSLRDMIPSLANYIKPIILVYSRGDVYDYFKSLGVEVYVVSYEFNYFPSSSNWVKMVLKYIYFFVRHEIVQRKGLKQILSILKSRNVSIVHSNTSAIDFGYVLARSLRVKHVWHIREMLPLFSGIQIMGGLFLLKAQMKCSDKLIFISHACKNFWNIKCDSNKKIVIGDAIMGRDELIYQRKKKSYILFCAQGLSEYKGADFAVKVFGISNLAQRGFRLKMIGAYGKNAKEKLDVIAKKYKIEKSVDYLGSLDINEIKVLMSEATLFLQPSKMEGLGRVSIEAIFCGCPVVARNCGGTLDFIKDGETGFLWDTEEECVKLLKKVVSSDNESLVLKAQELVRKQYSIEGYAPQIYNVYKTLL